LRERLRQADPQEPLIRQLITELDDKRFEVRERAARELKGFGPIVEPALRRVLKGQPSEEVRKRLEEVLAALRPPAGQLPAYQLRGLRALQALEHIGTPAAAQALQALAKQFPQTDIGQEAKAAQERITKRVTKQAADGQ
jgi:HEAT repeat protein